MPATADSPYTQEQLKVWFRGLLTIAWADGHFDDEEKELIETITQDELAPSLDLGHFQPVTSEELEGALGESHEMAENFLRMAVMVALADGVYSIEEDERLRSFCESLNLEQSVLDSVRSTLFDPNEVSQPTEAGMATPIQPPTPGEGKIDPLKPAREWLDQLDVQDPRLARFLCKMIPAQCPFERDVVLFGKKIVRIPPMCKLNPLYEQLVGLRFRSLSYLADECQEDVTPYL